MLQSADSAMLVPNLPSYTGSGWYIDEAYSQGPAGSSPDVRYRWTPPLCERWLGPLSYSLAITMIVVPEASM